MVFLSARDLKELRDNLKFRDAQTLTIIKKTSQCLFGVVVFTSIYVLANILYSAGGSL